MENKQTAVEFLIYLFSETIDTEFYKKEIEQAKQMEKQQIIKAYAKGVVNEISIYSTITGEEYYNETYAKNN